MVVVDIQDYGQPTQVGLLDELLHRVELAVGVVDGERDGSVVAHRRLCLEIERWHNPVIAKLPFL